MLTPDLVRASRRGPELRLFKLDGAQRERAVALAASFVALVGDHVGRTRGELRDAIADAGVEARDRKLADGLLKLLDERCTWDAYPVDAAALRARVFTAAAAERREHGAVDRAALLAAVAAEHDVDAAALERMLYADLKSEHVLTGLAPVDGEALVAHYLDAEKQAVLLRAVEVTVDLPADGAGADACRALFHKLKFRRLLHTIERREGGYRVRIDGPFSLFESVTRYGLQLALLWPAVKAMGRFELVASVRWGKRRQPLTFRLSGTAPASAATDAAALRDEVRELRDAFRARDSAWRVAEATALLDLPGVGLCIPDLRFTHTDGTVVYLEVLGFWSREAVWRRVDLVERGLAERLLFAVSKSLRVSEEVLPDTAPSALYVYKRKLSAVQVERRLEELRRR